MVETAATRPRRGPAAADLGDVRRRARPARTATSRRRATRRRRDRKFVEQWITAPFHAAGMLDPKLATTGFGAYRRAGATPWPAAATLDVIRGRTGRRPDDADVVPRRRLGAADRAAVVPRRRVARPALAVLRLQPGGGTDQHRHAALRAAAAGARPRPTLTATVEQNDVAVDSCAYDETTLHEPRRPVADARPQRARGPAPGRRDPDGSRWCRARATTSASRSPTRAR